MRWLHWATWATRCSDPPGVASGGRVGGEQKREGDYDNVSGNKDRRTIAASKGQEVPCRAWPMGRARGRVEPRLMVGL